MTERRLVGVDGCPGGWIGVSVALPVDDDARTDFAAATRHLFASIREIDAFAGEHGIIALDIPIGLPDTISGPGRVAEQTVRPLLGKRKSSVFSVPARRAVYATSYERACAIARETSNPPKALSKQAYNILAKIREVDNFLQENMGSRKRIYECHPELAFTKLNDGTPMSHAKKARMAGRAVGLLERRAVLSRTGFDEAFLRLAPERTDRLKPGLDDFIDACACLWVADRIARNLASPHPAPPHADSHEINIAIWA